MKEINDQLIGRIKFCGGTFVVCNLILLPISTTYEYVISAFTLLLICSLFAILSFILAILKQNKLLKQ